MCAATPGGCSMQYLTIDRDSSAVRNVLAPAFHPEPANRLVSVTRQDEIFWGKTTR